MAQIQNGLQVTSVACKKLDCMQTNVVRNYSEKINSNYLLNIRTMIAQKNSFLEEKVRRRGYIRTYIRTNLAVYFT